MRITIEIDDRARALYLKLSDHEIASTEEYLAEREVLLDLDASGKLVGVEILDPCDLDVEDILRNISIRYDVPDLTGLLQKRLLELAA